MRSLRPLHTIRASKSGFQHIRHFHPTRPSPFVHEVLEVSSSFLHGVHAVSGLPWALSIPLSAVFVRMTVALPLQVYTKIQAHRAQQLNPQILAWIESERKSLRVDNRKLAKPLLPAQLTRELNKRLKEEVRRLKKRWHVSRYYVGMNFLQVPIWISVMESLRAMSGVQTGLLGYLTSIFSSSASAQEALQIPVESSFATEGALWFPDLLAGDPTGILPVCLTASILLNIRSGWKTKTAKEIADLPKGLEFSKALAFKGLKGFLQLLALNIGLSFYVYQMPCALMVYWITSTNIATLQSLVLEKYVFPKSPFKPRKKMYIGLNKPQKTTSDLPLFF
ncbi:hypothetical protein ASPZODRAFT_64039 [Penicilliopsis zonata CBS 506.65]|uniref:Mitochondrial export translocase Oxa2 n=1 Tax=Penicilliopsis zonata CBS 506.65 TaxID=1073090 RepID=A0A1L9SKB5_9EURO|nr:hypothetical protein ASPZODRAFT_64039 [Penicilliopsis zonata CBS 506.65]OJJ47494.1 hypothetical protein ASPZODRAFT_64039 [Penicilliopsis zonata CBS 506.65]